MIVIITRSKSEVDGTVWGGEDVGSIPTFWIGDHKYLQNLHYSFMSLISQQDRTLAIKALEHYNSSFKDVMSESERAESNALLNWIKLEYNKHEH